MKDPKFGHRSRSLYVGNIRVKIGGIYLKN